MSSNCFLVVDDDKGKCLVIDPASEKSECEIKYIEERALSLDYIILTHEHTDHTWGVNALKDKYPEAKLVCSELCDQYALKVGRAYFLFYYDNPDYQYTIKPADVLIRGNEELLCWHNHSINFVMTPGHSPGSMCFDIDGLLFTGDTIMPFKPYLNRRDGNEEDWKNSVSIICNKYSCDTTIFPGHGEVLTIGEWKNAFF
jgi:glyoxylase-like metal-dependent hydrolase (beta-lactamase superfamily II)